jgi:hypothetical protein
MSLPEDEFWGIDNLKVTLYGTSAVPEPSSAIAFGGLGLLSLRFAKRRLQIRKALMT